ncbi:helix-turn-helix transcriptional regulator [Synechococcus sp. PCC 7336]|uniref:ArsR/SmtB family transcription factor n=1 Tax=Synechococcus sp. PCC 7336 TaxID=195250 RepID=UPI000347977A|nr:metalloregulator ArsR/SmtB family transcription factor [Synechococcus sp. PCC 7336]
MVPQADIVAKSDCFSDTPAKISLDSTEARAKLFAALADPTRLKIVELLVSEGELSSTEVANHLGISLALLCHHSKILIEAGLLTIRKQGQTKYRSVNRQLLRTCFDLLEQMGQ